MSKKNYSRTADYVKQEQYEKNILYIKEYIKNV